MKVFLDIEGTGTQNNQIAQLAYIKTDDDQNVVTAKNFFFKIDDMNPFAQRLHGLSMEYLRRASDGEIFKDRFEEINRDLADSLLVCHNTRSDYDLLAVEYTRLGKEYSPKGHFCTMAFFKPICEIHDRSGKIKPPSLRELIDFHEFSNDEIASSATTLFECLHVKPHDSRFDAAAIYLICKKAVSLVGFAGHHPQDLPQRPVSAVIVPLSSKRRAKEINEAKKKAVLSHYRNPPRYAKWAIPLVISLVIISLLLRMR